MLFRVLIAANLLVSVVWSFQSSFRFQHQQQCNSRLFLSSESSGATPGGTTEEDAQPKFETPKFAGYEYGEMSIVVEEMKRRNTKCNSLIGDDRDIMELYLQRIITLRPSLIALTDIQRVIPDSKWKLVFSTQDTTMSNLPDNASVYLNFQDETNLEYILQFPKDNFGVKRIVAESTYSTSSGDTNPGHVMFTYRDVKTDVFGFTGLGANPFGMLEGNTNVIQSAYFDGNYWIEMGSDGDLGKEELYFNVYVRDFEPGSPDEAQQNMFLNDLHQQTRLIGEKMEEIAGTTNKRKFANEKYTSTSNAADQWD